MVAKPGTIFLIMKMASEVGPLSSCCCMIFLTSNDFGGGAFDQASELDGGIFEDKNPDIQNHGVS